ncbi:outer membrane lipoprotein carrier protein LolA [Methanosarcina sp. Z-7115]|uniref:Outer membrane lipoprotein carrier protein LolA n=1 Tax=Methanosarcina baikalica TaxID=3073890 RepID=A0ABU2D1R0_9EURY|nr:outer membrane lipoprotein carrier protein LolA [Methanosarcina sp. Z-7115]MDR7665924.1 outer membrane lipoprotein carrier protein LolA [Methanosarcina sp. Z-7115]
MVKKKMVAMFILLTGYIIFVSGCMDKPDTKELELSMEEISAKMQEKEKSINDSSYTVYVTMYSDGEKTQENEFNITYKKPNMKKTVTKQAGKETLMVLDGSVEWNYDPETNSVQKIIISDEYQEPEIDYFQFFNNTLNEYNVSLLGTEIIDGRNTYLLEAKPKETGGDVQDYSIDRMKVWVDNETWMPLKYEIYAGTQKVEIKIQNLKVNTGIPDSEFRFDVPEGANVTTMNFEDTFNENLSERGKKIPPEGEKDTAIGVVV